MDAHLSVSSGDGGNPSPSGEEKLVVVWSRTEVATRRVHEVRSEVHLVWIPKYRKKVLLGPLAIRLRDLIRQIAIEHEWHIISGKVARDHVHVFLSYRPHQDSSTIVQWLKGISSGVP